MNKNTVSRSVKRNSKIIKQLLRQHEISNVKVRLKKVCFCKKIVYCFFLVNTEYVIKHQL